MTSIRMAPWPPREAIEDYVRRFLPAYEIYGAAASPRFAVLDERRLPL